MPARPHLVIDRSDGSERARIDALTAADTRSLVDQWRATATVDRSGWLAVTDAVDNISDRFRIERGDGSVFFAGRFGDDERSGDTVTITVNSYEQDAIDAEPTSGQVAYSNVADSTVVSDAIANVPTLSEGTIETGTTSSWTFSHAERSKQIRDAAEPAGMDVAYRPDRTVDFLTRLGSDKSGSITVSNTDQTIVESLDVIEDNQNPVTHIQGIGAQRGPDAVEAEATIASYSAGERQVWREYTNKDVVKQDRLQAIVDRLADEHDSAPRRLTVEAGLVDVAISLGDSVQVVIPDHDIDEALRIVRLREVIGPQDRYVATLTNRGVERGGGRKRRDDLRRFNTGYQGFVDRDNDSFGFQPVTASTNAIRTYWYPDDVETEILAEVVVTSKPYRALSSGAAAGGDHTHTVDVTHPSHTHDVTHPSHDHDVSISTTSTDNSDHSNVEEAEDTGVFLTAGSGWDTIASFSPTSDSSFLVCYVNVEAFSAGAIDLRLNKNNGSDFFPDSNGYTLQPPADETVSAWFMDASDVDNDDFDLEIDGTDGDSFTAWVNWWVIGQHTHDRYFPTECS